jgi:hypothetical protein
VEIMAGQSPRRSSPEQEGSSHKSWPASSATLFQKEKVMVGFVWIRRYTRIRFGCIEHVRAHWRGIPK